MYTLSEAKEMINTPDFEKINSLLYSDGNLQTQRSRYLRSTAQFAELFPLHEKMSFFSAPGRTEIAGNHTDHQNGRVIAAAIDRDVMAVAAPRNDNVIKIYSEGYPMIEISTHDLSQRDDERNTSHGLVRGIASGLNQLGYKVGGFDAYITSTVPAGSGLSSSAAFEVVVATIFNQFYNENQIEKIDIAKICQYAENHYFGKPCGLMDQTASAIGGFVYIDFKDPGHPYVEQLYLNLSHFDYSLCIVDTGTGHQDLSEDYAAVKRDMTAVANHLGKDVLSQVSLGDFLEKLPAIREKLGDIAILRALHFFRENDRVKEQTEAIGDGDFDSFLQLVLESGRSSFMYNQNVFSPESPAKQSLSVALGLSETILDTVGGWRVHGGGFAGTIQSYVPTDLLGAYKALMTSVFGRDSVIEVKIRTVGGVCVEQLLKTNG